MKASDMRILSQNADKLHEEILRRIQLAADVGLYETTISRDTLSFDLVPFKPLQYAPILEAAANWLQSLGYQATTLSDCLHVSWEEPEDANE